MTNDSHKARLAALVQELSVIHEKVIQIGRAHV